MCLILLILSVSFNYLLILSIFFFNYELSHQFANNIIPHKIREKNCQWAWERLVMTCMWLLVMMKCHVLTCMLLVTIFSDLWFLLKSTIFWSEPHRTFLLSVMFQFSFPVRSHVAWNIRGFTSNLIIIKKP